MVKCISQICGNCVKGILKNTIVEIFGNFGDNDLHDWPILVYGHFLGQWDW